MMQHDTTTKREHVCIICDATAEWVLQNMQPSNTQYPFSEFQAVPVEKFKWYFGILWMCLKMRCIP